MIQIDSLDLNIFTLPLDPQVISQWRSFSPSLKKHSMLDELSDWNTFTQHVCWLIICIDWMNCDFSCVHIVPKMMILHIHKLCPWSNLVNRSDLKRSTVVFENFTMNFWDCCADVETTFFHFFGQFHDWDDLS